MPVRTGTDRLAGLIPPFIHSFLKMPYPETDGIRYFFAPRYAADSPHKRGQPFGCPLEALRRESACILPKRCKKAIRTQKPLDCAPVCPPAMQKVSGGMRRTVASRQALPKAMRAKDGEPFPRGIAAESGLPLAKALQKGHTHTEAAGLRPRVLSRLL